MQGIAITFRAKGSTKHSSTSLPAGSSIADLQDAIAGLLYGYRGGPGTLTASYADLGIPTGCRTAASIQLTDNDPDVGGNDDEDRMAWFINYVAERYLAQAAAEKFLGAR